jgi:beta-xylosidase
MYRSSDLENWDRLKNIVELPSDFWADMQFWAPEVYRRSGKYYMFVSCMKEGKNRGTHTLVSDSGITGPYRPVSKRPATPAEWMCLDGTLYTDAAGRPYMVFCHEWIQAGDGEIWVGRLSEDLASLAEEPRLLIKAKESGFSAEYGGGEVRGYVTDGPQIYTCKNGDLLLIWSSMGRDGYFSAVARSVSGIYGPFKHEKILYGKDGGHSMVFFDFDGNMKYTFHSPNDSPEERAVIKDAAERDNDLFVIE